MIDLKHLRGATTSAPTTPTSAAYTGPIGEILVDTDGFGHGGPLLRVQDGVTAGGWPVGGTVGTATFTLDPVTTGLSHTVGLTSPAELTYWSSATAGAKGTSLPGAAAGNKGYQWIHKTTLDNGDIHTITPTSGTMDGGGSFSYSDAKTSSTWISDGVSNWMLVG
jgi:hypothetical protein